MKKQRITPCLWFDGQAEEAARFYTSIFPNSEIGRILHYDQASAKVSGMPAGSVLTVTFTLDGQAFTALNGGPLFKFTEAISFEIACKTQEELDHYWDALTSGGGEESQCGWLKDRFGVSWQVVPENMETLLADPDPVKAQRVMAALLQMKKLDFAGLMRAYEGRA